jgi:hypothetical protein
MDWLLEDTLKLINYGHIFTVPTHWRTRETMNFSLVDWPDSWRTGVRFTGWGVRRAVATDSNHAVESGGSNPAGEESGGGIAAARRTSRVPRSRRWEGGDVRSRRKVGQLRCLPIRIRRTPTSRWCRGGNDPLSELGRLRLASVRVDEAEEVRSPTRAQTAWFEWIEVLGAAAFDRRSMASG